MLTLERPCPLTTGEDLHRVFIQPFFMRPRCPFLCFLVARLSRDVRLPAPGWMRVTVLPGKSTGFTKISQSANTRSIPLRLAWMLPNHHAPASRGSTSGFRSGNCHFSRLLAGVVEYF